MKNRPAPIFLSAAFLSVLVLAGCEHDAPRRGQTTGATPPPLTISVTDNAEMGQPLPLLEPYGGIMIGIIDGSASVITSATKVDRPLTDTEWTTTGLAGVNIISASTLLTLPASGREDAQRLADPRWRNRAEDMQNASVLVLAAVQARDRETLRDASSFLTETCQACHQVFKHGVQTNTRTFADR